MIDTLKSAAALIGFGVALTVGLRLVLIPWFPIELISCIAARFT